MLEFLIERGEAVIVRRDLTEAGLSVRQAAGWREAALARTQRNRRRSRNR